MKSWLKIPGQFSQRCDGQSQYVKTKIWFLFLRILKKLFLLFYYANFNFISLFIYSFLRNSLHCRLFTQRIIREESLYSTGSLGWVLYESSSLLSRRCTFHSNFEGKTEFCYILYSCVALVSCILAFRALVNKDQYTHKKRVFLIDEREIITFCVFFRFAIVRVSFLIVPRWNIARSGHLLTDLFLL